MVREKIQLIRDQCFTISRDCDSERLDSEAQFRRISLLWMAGIMLTMVPMATLIDVPVARWFLHHPLPGIVRTALEGFAQYGDALGVALVVTTILLLSKNRRWSVPRLATMAGGAGAVATIAKMFILRPRPNALPIESSAYDYAWIWSFDWTLSKVVNFDPSTRAFPSASLATAAALTVGLWIITPRFRYLGVGLCFVTMLQRASCGAHFVSDLCGSAVIGLTWAFVCFHPKWMGSIFDRIEHDHRRKQPSNPDVSAIQLDDADAEESRQPQRSRKERPSRPKAA